MGLQEQLFDTGPEPISNAVFSEDRKYRYSLERIWDKNKPMVMFIGLNPSKANETKTDNTITRVRGFAESWGYGGFYMTNLFAYVSTDPDELITSGEDIEKNNAVLIETAAKSDKVVFAWGCFEKHVKRMEEVIKMFPEAYCISFSKKGFPNHPLMLRKDLQLKKFKK